MISVAILFGSETVLAGILGVIAGSFLGQKFRKRFPTADPLVCAFGLVVSAPFMLATLVLADGSPAPTFTVMFFGQLFLNLNWSLVADITLVNMGKKRSRFVCGFLVCLLEAFHSWWLLFCFVSQTCQRLFLSCFPIRVS